MYMYSKLDLVCVAKYEDGCEQPRRWSSHLLSLHVYRRSNSNIFIFRDASRAGELRTGF